MRAKPLLAALTAAGSLALGACGETPRDAALLDAVIVEKGMYFKPELNDFSLHNEYDDDGNGDGIRETHIRRYISPNGDSAFSMSTGGRLWAWSLDIHGDDDSDTHRNFVIRDSNCDGVFDERYNLNAEFHVPSCVLEAGAGEQSA